MDNQYQNNGGYDYNTYNYSQPTNNSDMLEGGFESGSPVMSSIENFKGVIYQEVVAKSYLFMFFALLVTAFASLTVTPEVSVMILSGYNFFILVGVEFAIVLISNWAISKNNAILAGILYTVYAYITGVTFSFIFSLFTTSSILQVFLITSLMFFVMSVYGLATKRDLTKFGSILIMALLGAIIASVVNMFMRSSAFDYMLTYIVVIIFAGLTAYDSQKIKNRVYCSNSENVLCLALYGAFEIYLDFINIFIRLLRILGKRR